MKRFVVALSLLLVGVGSTYLAWSLRNWSLAAVTATAILGLLGMFLCWRRPRYAALFAAINLLVLTTVGVGAGNINVHAESSVLGSARLLVSTDGPSPWPTIVGAAILLLFQGLIEVTDRGLLGRIAGTLNLGWATTTSNKSTAIINSPSDSVVTGHVGDHNSGQIGIGHGISQVQINVDIDGEIQAAADLLESGRIQSAEEDFQRIETRYGSNLTPHQKYRVFANLGNVNVRKALYETAANFFVQAAGATEDVSRAEVCQAYASALRGDHATGLNAAVAILDRNTTDSLAASLRISCDMSDVPSHELRSELSAEVKDSANVIFACITREGRGRRFAEAEKLAREALRKNPDDPSFQAELARTIVAQFDHRYGRRVTPESLSKAHKGRLEEAIRLVTATLRNSEIEFPDSSRSDLLSIRGLARSFVGQQDGALTDWGDAASLSESVDNCLLPYAIQLDEAGRTDDAIEFLEAKIARHSDVRLGSLCADLLSRRDAPGDQAKAKMILTEAFEQDTSGNSAATMLGLMTLADVIAKTEPDQRQEFATQFERFRQRLTPLANRIVLAHAARVFDDLGEADFQASMALLALSTCDDDDERRQLAVVLNSLDRKAECANLFSLCTKTDCDSASLRLMFQSALDAKMDGLFLEKAHQLRRNGIFVETTVQNEASTLSKYHAFTELTELLQQAIDNQLSVKTRKWIRYARSVAAVHVGRLDLVETDPSLIPTASEHALSELSNYTKVMRFGPGPRVAIDQLYDLIRKDRNAVEPKQAFFAVVQLGDQYEAIPKPKAVCTGCAVLAKTDGGASEWHVIEDGEAPESSHNEFPPEHPTIKPLLGKQVGDTAVVIHGFDTTKLTIERIIDKRLYLCGQIMETFPEKHPDAQFLFRFTVPHRLDGTPDMRVLGVQMQFWKKGTDEQINVYRNNPIPLSSFAMAAGRPLAAAWWHVAEDKNLPIRVILGQQEEIANATGALRSESPLVLEPCAAMTLLYTGLWKELSASKLKLLIPIAVLNDLWCLIADSSFNEDGGNTLHVAGDTPYIKSGDIEGWARHRWRVGQFLLWLQKECDVVDSLALSRLSPIDRRSLEKTVGYSTASALAIAAEQEAVLWSDDATVAILGQQRGVKSRVWTLAVAEHCASNGFLLPDRLDNLRCDLIAFGYSHFPLEVSTFIRAGERAEWDPKRFPLNGVCHWFSNPALVPQLILNVLIGSLSELHKHKLLAHQEEAVFNKVLESVTQRPDGQKIANTVLSVIGKIYPFEILQQDRVANAVRKWRTIAAQVNT